GRWGGGGVGRGGAGRVARGTVGERGGWDRAGGEGRGGARRAPVPPSLRAMRRSAAPNPVVGGDWAHRLRRTYALERSAPPPLHFAQSAFAVVHRSPPAARSGAGPDLPAPV